MFVGMPIHRSMIRKESFHTKKKQMHKIVDQVTEYHKGEAEVMELLCAMGNSHQRKWKLLKDIQEFTQKKE